MANSSKQRQDRHCTSEVNTARSKLDGVLQTLMIKSEDSPEPSETESVKTSPDICVVDPCPAPSSPKKAVSASKPPRKRRRKDDSSSNDANSYHHTFVMKLFDRSVDLAEFTEETPLYPVCRAWMHHLPRKRPKSRSPSPERRKAAAQDYNSLSVDDIKDESKPREVVRLPPPLPRLSSGDEGPVRDVRIPSPVPSLDKTLDIHEDPESYPSREVLISHHMTRWKAVRQKWKEASFANETRYKDSLSVLKSLFER